MLSGSMVEMEMWREELLHLLPSLPTPSLEEAASFGKFVGTPTGIFALFTIMLFWKEPRVQCRCFQSLDLICELADPFWGKGSAVTGGRSTPPHTHTPSNEPAFPDTHIHSWIHQEHRATAQSKAKLAHHSASASG
jgi:hypothetical protein